MDPVLYDRWRAQAKGLYLEWLRHYAVEAQGGTPISPTDSFRGWLRSGKRRYASVSPALLLVRQTGLRMPEQARELERRLIDAERADDAQGARDVASAIIESDRERDAQLAKLEDVERERDVQVAQLLAESAKLRELLADRDERIALLSEDLGAARARIEDLQRGQEEEKAQRWGEPAPSPPPEASYVPPSAAFVPPPPPPPPMVDTARVTETRSQSSALLAQIRQGTALRKVAREAQDPSTPSQVEDSLFAAIKNAVRKRRTAMVGVPVCAGCNVRAARYQCPCKAAAYCSEGCQEAHWVVEHAH